MRADAGIGGTMVAPALLRHGTDAQRASFLPGIESGRDVYAQAFTEAAGGLAAEGVVDGDDLVVTGSKAYVAGAADATMLLVLVTTVDGPTCVLVPIGRDGVEVRPTRDLTGREGLADVVLDGVRVPLANVLGGLGAGRQVAATARGAARDASAATDWRDLAEQFWALVELVRKLGREGDALVRQDLAWAWSQVQILKFLALRVLAALTAGQDPDPGLARMSELLAAEFEQRLGEIAVDLAGADSLIGASDGWDGADGVQELVAPWQERLLDGRGATLHPAPVEVLRTELAEQALGLPAEESTTADGGTR